ncbi:hypothetical protein PG987_001142 [Apiospora arundinis]
MTNTDDIQGHLAMADPSLYRQNPVRNEKPGEKSPFHTTRCRTRRYAFLIDGSAYKGRDVSRVLAHLAPLGVQAIMEGQLPLAAAGRVVGDFGNVVLGQLTPGVATHVLRRPGRAAPLHGRSVDGAPVARDVDVVGVVGRQGLQVHGLAGDVYVCHDIEGRRFV